jgi:hypothetical protein
MSKAKRGDAIVISVDTTEGGWRIAKAAKTEKGIVKEYKLPGDTRTFETQPVFMRVYTISDKERQEKARKLFAFGKPVICNSYAEMRDAILAA